MSLLFSFVRVRSVRFEGASRSILTKLASSSRSAWQCIVTANTQYMSFTVDILYAMFSRLKTLVQS